MKLAALAFILSAIWTLFLVAVLKVGSRPTPRNTQGHRTARWLKFHGQIFEK